MPQDFPALGETWQSLSSVDNIAATACIVAITPDGDVVRMAFTSGRVASMPVRSLLLTWRLVPTSDGTALSGPCAFDGCGQPAFISQVQEGGDTGYLVCHRHVMSGLRTILSGQVTPGATPVTAGDIQQARVYPEGPVLSACPCCGTTENLVANINCWRCGARWRTISPDIPLTDMAAAVADTKREMRRMGLNATYIRMQEAVSQVVVHDNRQVPEHNEEGHTVLISRGTQRGGGLVFAGLPVYVVQEGATVLVAASTTQSENQEGPRYIRTADFVCYAHTGRTTEGDLILDRLGFPTGASRLILTTEQLALAFRPIDELIPSKDSYWWDPSVPRSFITVTGYAQEIAGACNVRYTDDRNSTFYMLLGVFLRKHLRFDQEMVITKGSVWADRKTSLAVAVEDLDESFGVAYVVTRNVDGVTTRILCRDLWENYELRSMKSDPFPCEVNEEWSDANGVNFDVKTFDNDLGVATLLSQATSQRIQVSRSMFEAYTKVERRNVLDRLRDEDPFGWDA